MNFSQYYEARSLIEDFLRKDLFGPVVEDEIITETIPTDYYICGRLFPQNTRINQEELEQNGIEEQTEDNEQPMNLCNSAFPSSIALSFTIKKGAKKLKVIADFAWYEPIEKKAQGKGKQFSWHRKAESQIIEIKTEHEFCSTELRKGLELRSYLQKEYDDGSKTMTVAMVNTCRSQMDNTINNANTYFQPRIQITGMQKNQSVFIEKQMRVNLNKDQEVRNLEMLYRYNRSFAVGHGCSAGWQVDGEYAKCIFTEFIPSYELLQMKPVSHVNNNILSFEFLGQTECQEVCTGLGKIVESYNAWINEREKEIVDLPTKFQKVATNNLCQCRLSLERIQAGIKLMVENREIFAAFQLVNQAMLRQRGQIAKSGDNGSHSWYLFQLAFILQEIQSIAMADDSYRNVVDLLWFPTGGGKTEAYLGLTAFTIFLRRLRAVQEDRSGAGVTVLMRYTLRLLTLQQFERASALICACELIRRENTNLLGEEEIGIGLWVGGNLTPIKRSKTKKALKVIHEEGFDSLKNYDDLSNPCQVLRCPWCKTELKPQHYLMNEEKMLIKCPNAKCPFNIGLPLYLIDDDICDYRPALVVGTIDKFARMTWEPNVGKIFALDCDLLPPELIIQDELHLISGPLGTIAGLYEVAVDEFSRNNNTRAKIVASTATIRNAQNQILNLYGRDFHQFPPTGLDIRDNYFANESIKDDRPSREYIGIMAPGSSSNTLLIRVYSILLFSTRYLKVRGYSNEIIDSFWTLTGYFNSLKQLGGAVINVIDDVTGRLKYLNGTKFKNYFRKGENIFNDLLFDELTSRKDSSEIGDILNKLETQYPDSSAFDLILASNMLSVGIDIGRLGLMILLGQPKSNSEYIQATSRVGRQTPGLVITIHDASRSRDRSHYEQFLSYHSAFYKYVEATSLTPFAERARDRALHAVLISQCRQSIKELNDNNNAYRINEFIAEAESFIDLILKRVSNIDKDEYQNTKEHLKEILDKWLQMSEADLVYRNVSRKPGKPLLTYMFNTGDDSFSTLNSMRNVDVECEIELEG